MTQFSAQKGFLWLPYWYQLATINRRLLLSILVLSAGFYRLFGLDDLPYDYKMAYATTSNFLNKSTIIKFVTKTHHAAEQKQDENSKQRQPCNICPLSNVPLLPFGNLVPSSLRFLMLLVVRNLL